MMAELQPQSRLPANRPQVPSQPCAACGEAVDPLRASAVLAFDDGLRFLCSSSCSEAFRGGARFRVARTPASGLPRATPVGNRAAVFSTPPSGTPPAMDEERSSLAPPVRLLPSVGQGALPVLKERPSAWLALACALLAMLAAPFAQAQTELGTLLATFSAALSVISALCVASLTINVARELGVVNFWVGPLGIALAAAAAHSMAMAGHGGWMLGGAAFAALALLVRALLDADGQGPVEVTVTALTRGLPENAKVPIQQADDPYAISVEPIKASELRTGEDVIAARGDTLAVDGVVQAGSARVVAYPGAEAVISRSVGDSVLAGARVVDGAIRVIATRVGAQRGLVRIANIGRYGHGPASIATTASRFTRLWGGVAVLGLALAAGLLVNDSRPGSGLAAGAAVLIAAPLLSLLRALRTPLLAAAAHAGARGIVFQSAAAIEHAGRVSTVATSPHGILTEGTPEVVEVHMVGEGAVVDTVAAVAAAERAAGARAIPLAIERYATSMKVPAVEVRRAQLYVGRGVSAITAHNEELVVGSRRFLLESGVSVAIADAEVARAEASGRTSVFVALGGRLRAVISLQDHLRSSARAAVQRLIDMGLEMVLLTGDQRGPVQTLASGLDIAHVKAELLPQERAQAVRSLQDAGGQVAVVGHQGSDDAALSAADVGVVLSAAGNVSGERNVALVSDDIRDAASALWIAHATYGQVLRAARMAILVYAAAVVAATAGLLSPGLAALVTLAVDAQALSAGARLLRRFALRLPAHG